jgi:hypothetical protein
MLTSLSKSIESVREQVDLVIKGTASNEDVLLATVSLSLIQLDLHSMIRDVAVEKYLER